MSMSVDSRKNKQAGQQLSCQVNVTPVETLDRAFQLSEMGASFQEYHEYHGRHKSHSVFGEEDSSRRLRVFEKIVMAISVMIAIVTFPLSLIFCFRIVRQFERMVVFRVGRVLKISGPGTLLVIPCVDRTKVLDLRIFSFKVASKDIMLSDSVQISVKAVCWSRIICPLSAIVSTEDYLRSTRLLSTGILRRFLGYKTLEAVVSPPKEFSKELVAEINRITLKFGVKIERMEIKSLQIQKRMQQTMAVEGTSYAYAQAKQILSEGERDAALGLTAAAANYDRTALQLRFMQALMSLQGKTEDEATVIFPVPLDMGFHNMIKNAKLMKERMREQFKRYQESKDRRKTSLHDFDGDGNDQDKNGPLSPRIPFDDLLLKRQQLNQGMQEEDDSDED